MSMPAPLPVLEDQVTLTQLAALYGCSTTNLRQRIARKTLAAQKIGPVWVVDRPEAIRLLREVGRWPHE